MADDSHSVGFFPADVLAAAARRFPQKIALIFKDEELTFGALDRKVSALAAHLRDSRIDPGDRVGLLLPNSIAFALAYYATQRAGAVTVVLDARLKGKELAGVLRDADLKLLITHQKLAGDAREAAAQSKKVSFWIVEGAGEESFERRLEGERDFTPAARAAEDDALILYTSGTTGEPKGVVLNSVNLAQFPRVMAAMHHTTAETIWGCILPMSHISGPIYLNEIADKASRMVIFDQFNPVTLLEGIQKHRVTVFHGVPIIFQLLLNLPNLKSYDTSSVELAGMMGTTVPLALMRAFKSAQPHVKVIQGYGLTETSPLLTLTEPQMADAKMASIGRAVPGIEIKIVDDSGRALPEGEAGEIVTRGPHVMKGYFRRAAATAERIRGDWFYTGDIGKKDADGYFYHLGRKDDMIITGGLNVYPAEVENMLAEHPAVEEAVVFPIAEPKRGHVIGAAVVSRPGQRAAEKELLGFLRANLASFKVPQKIVVRDSLPRNATGKVIRDAKILLGEPQ
ncbi:MAG TPA: AMP-binding protein [Verrucomicrobiae bacterium]|nr:AMP-binding protein [Verrucomicrobiae bacterium]